MKKTYIIAEAGVNHNGDLQTAKKLVRVAVDAGADAVKFQTFKADTLVCKNVQKAEYQLATTKSNESQYDMLKQLEMSYDMHVELISFCKKLGIQFLSTPFDIESIHLLEQLEIPLFKIPSGDITNYPYLREIGKIKKPVILSTGMSKISEIKEALHILQSFGTSDISVLHCNTQYPTPMQDANLKAIQTMRRELRVPIGYSDHTKGIEVCIAAVAMGAEIIEKHFTLDCTMKGPDHKASLEPDELKTMINSIRNIEQAIGDGIKKPTSSEKANIAVARKSIVASCAIKSGDTFNDSNLTAKRPGTGISPMRWNEVVGTSAKRDYMKDDLIEL